jgi:Mce-associated membrane protein
MSDPRPPRRRVAGERSRLRRDPLAPVAPVAPVPPGPRTADEPGAEAAPTTPTVPTIPAVPATPADTEPEAGSRGSRLNRLSLRDGALVALGVLALALIASAGILAYRVHEDQAADSARSAATAAARTAARQVLSYDHRHLDADFARASRLLTSPFKGDYAKTTRTVVRPTAVKYQAVVKADVVATSVVRGTGDRVVLLLFVNQTTTSTRLSGPRVDLNRVRMTMAKVDGKWLVSGLDAL